MSSLFIQSKNVRRPNPAPSTSSQNGQNYTSSSSSSLAPQSSNSRARTVSNPNVKPGSSRASLPHASLPASHSASLPLDPAIRARVETLLAQILQLFHLQSQNIGTATGSFETSDLASEEAADLLRMWDEGKKASSDREKKEREMLGKNLVDDLGGLLMRLAEKVGTELVDRKIELFRRDIDSLRNSSSTSSNPNNDRFSLPPPPPPPPQSGAALSNALDRIQVLEQQLQNSEQEREQLRQTFEQRLSALENKTVDPRKRVSTAGAGTPSTIQGGGGASNAAAAQSVALADLDKLKKEVEELRGSEKRARDAEAEDRQGREKIQKLKEQVELQGTKLEQVQSERDVYLQKLQTQSTTLDTLSAQVSTLPSITERESNLLRGLYEFLSSSSPTSIESLTPSELSSLLTQRLVELHNTIQSYRSSAENMQSTVDVHGQRLTLLHEKLSELKPFFNYMSERALPDIQKSLAVSKAREADGVESGGAEEGEDEADQMMEESEEERAIERQLVNGANGTRSSPADKDRAEEERNASSSNGVLED